MREWIVFQKKKWAFQMRQKRGVDTRNNASAKFLRRDDSDFDRPCAGQGPEGGGSRGVIRTGGTLGGFFKRAQKNLLDTPWQIIQIVETGQPGKYRP